MSILSSIHGLPDEIELVDLQLGMWLGSDTGDSVRTRTQVFQHNHASDEELLDAFDRQSSHLREQLRLFLSRRIERRIVVEREKARRKAKPNIHAP